MMVRRKDKSARTQRIASRCAGHVILFVSIARNDPFLLLEGWADSLHKLSSYTRTITLWPYDESDEREMYVSGSGRISLSRLCADNL